MGKRFWKGYIYLFSGFWFTFMLYFPFVWHSLPLNINMSIHGTLFPKCHLSIEIFSCRLLNSFTHLENCFLSFNNPKSVINDSFKHFRPYYVVFLHNICIAIYLLILLNLFPFLYPKFARKILVKISLLHSSMECVLFI